MAKSKIQKFARKQTGTIIAIGALALVLSLAVFAFSDRQRLYSKLEEKVFGNETSGNETSENETPGNETPGNETSGNETSGNESSITDTIKTYYNNFRTPTPTLKPITATALSNYTRIIKNATNSGYEGLGQYSSRTVTKNNLKDAKSASDIRSGQITQSNNNVQTKEQQIESGVSPYLTNYKPTTKSNTKTTTKTTRNDRATRYSNIENDVKTKVNNANKTYSAVTNNSNSKKPTKPKRLF